MGDIQHVVEFKIKAPYLRYYRINSAKTSRMYKAPKIFGSNDPCYMTINWEIHVYFHGLIFSKLKQQH